MNTFVGQSLNRYTTNVDVRNPQAMRWAVSMQREIFNQWVVEAAYIGNRGYVPQLPEGCAVEVPVLVDASGLQPTVVHDIPPQLIALMRTNINVQDLTVQALMTENPDHIYHAAMLDPHTGAELDLDQIWQLTTELLEAHGDWLPGWARVPVRKAG